MTTRDAERMEAGRERLLAFFEARCERGDPGDCWRWTGHIDKNGYGQGSPTRQLTGQYAHRLAYELFIGPIPPGLHLDHLCRNRGCCNPEHLEPVSIAENVLRGEGATAEAARATHCPSGHPYAGDNLYVKPNGVRVCRACKRAGDRARRERRVLQKGGDSIRRRAVQPKESRRK